MQIHTHPPQQMLAVNIGDNRGRSKRLHWRPSAEALSLSVGIHIWNSCPACTTRSFSCGDICVQVIRDTSQSRPSLPRLRRRIGSSEVGHSATPAITGSTPAADRLYVFFTHRDDWHTEHMQSECLCHRLATPSWKWSHMHLCCVSSLSSLSSSDQQVMYPWLYYKKKLILKSPLTPVPIVATSEGNFSNQSSLPPCSFSISFATYIQATWVSVAASPLQGWGTVFKKQFHGEKRRAHTCRQPLGGLEAGRRVCLTRLSLICASPEGRLPSKSWTNIRDVI